MPQPQNSSSITVIGQPLTMLPADNFCAKIRVAGISLWWLGQAGFALQAGRFRLLIDPYLSDSLADKYRGKEFPHVRMMPPPVDPHSLKGVDWVLCTHGHTDHLDGGTLPGVAVANPSCRFAVPRTERATAIARGVPEDRLVAVNAGDTLALGDGAELRVIPAAHEQIETTAAGDHRFVGYLVQAGGVTLYHSGDCVPYAGLVQALVDAKVDVALLPVNGRDAYRLARNILGNFTFDEAVDICRQADIPVLLPHHWGMFEFNTVSPDDLRKRIAALDVRVQVILPEINQMLVINPFGKGAS